MKHIIKSSEPISFTNWKRTHPGLRYKDLKGSPKTDLKNALISEQKHLCCYCERRIYDADSHIEHFRPKGNPLYQHLELDYNNLHASCIKYLSTGVEPQCGHKKENTFTNTLLSPLEPDCACHFWYTLDGVIHSVDDRGKEAIDIYNLNSGALIRQRKGLIDFFTSDLSSEADIIDHLDSSKSCLGEFYTMIEYLYNNNNI